MKFVYTLIILTSYTIGFSHCSQNLQTEKLNSSELSPIEDEQCPPWSYYDVTSEHCKCYESRTSPREERVVECTDRGVLLAYTYCMTYNNESGIVSTSYCPYFDIQSYSVFKPGRIRLPDNISELNHYMCGPMNRKGLVCSECIDGYGPSVTSSRYRCADCSNVWYGVTLYIVTEVVPVTIFYIIVLLFQLNLTSAPMTGFVLYSNFVVLGNTFATLVTSSLYTTIITLLYGILTLDFIRPVIPPVCISPKLRIIHVMYLQSLSAVLPFVFTAITWILINLQCCDNKGVKWMSKIVQKVVPKRFKIHWNSDRTVVDAFATFFLLSFAKVTFLLIIPFYPLRAQHVSSLSHSSNVSVHPFGDLTEDYASTTQLPFMIISMCVFLFAVLPIIVTIALYPTRPFRNILLRYCKDRYICTLKIFLDKFYSCFKDGLNGERDMRSFASTYFFLTLLSYVLWSLDSFYTLLSVLYGGWSLVILIVQPYKERYMTVLESLVLANLAFLAVTWERNIYAIDFHRILADFSAVLPILGLTIFVLFKLFGNQRSKLFQTVKAKISSIKLCLCSCVRNNPGEDSRVESGQRDNTNVAEEGNLPDRMVHPEQYTPTQENSVTY